MFGKFFFAVRSILGCPPVRRHPIAVSWRALCWLGHCALRTRGRAYFRHWNFVLELPPTLMGQGATLLYLFREEYEPELLFLDKILRPGMVFVDAGANAGVYTCAAARLVGPEGHVVAFEPVPSCLQMLRRSLEINRFEQVIVQPKALSDRCATVRIYHNTFGENSYTLGVAENMESEEVESVTLERGLEQCGIERVDVIKMDIEGAEELALRGSESLFRRCKPIVLFEVNANACRGLGLEPGGAKRLLSSMGYRFYTTNHDGKLREAINDTVVSQNYIAVHESVEFHA
jgi:FkbM family methyltransferase